MAAQDAPWMAPTSLVGAAGEHYCMTQLLLRGCLAALTPHGSPDADILVRSPDGAIAAEVQVKARSGRAGRGWRMSEKHQDVVRPRLLPRRSCPPASPRGALQIFAGGMLAGASVLLTGNAAKDRLCQAAERSGLRSSLIDVE